MKYIYRKVRPVYQTITVRKWWYFGKAEEKSVIIWLAEKIGWTEKDAPYVS